MTNATPTTAARAERIAAIRNGAIVREALGQAARYLLLPDGKHQVSIIDRGRREVRTVAADTLEEAIRQALDGRPRQREATPATVIEG